MKKILLVGIFVLSASFGAYSGELEVPRHLVEQIVSTNMAPASVTTALYAWVSEEIKQQSPNAILKALSSHILIDTNEHLVKWETRINFLDTNIAPRIAALLWKSGSKELLCMKLDLPEETLRIPGYSVSYGGIIIAKEKDATVQFKFPDGGISTATRPIFCFLGLLAGSDGSQWPDIIYSEGPAGSGNFIYLHQIHYSEEKKTWEVVWNTNRAHASAVRFLYPQEVQIEFFRDKFIGPKDTNSILLHWGHS